MSREEAVQLAKIYLAGDNQGHPLALDNLRILNSPTEYGACWYFDYRYHHQNKLPDESRDMIGVAPGFIIAKQGKQIQVISWNQLYELNQTPFQF